MGNTKCVQMGVQEFLQHSCATGHSAADRGCDVCQGQDSCGFQGTRAAKNESGSLLRGPPAGRVDVHVSKKDGSALLKSKNTAPWTSRASRV